MYPRCIAYTILVVVLIFAFRPTWAQPDCSDWNTWAFFQAAELTDIERCLRAGADPNHRNDSGNTPIHSVARDGSLEVVKALLDAGADPNAHQQTAWPALFSAASMQRNPAVVKALLDAGANPNTRYDGQTPLHWAATNPNYDVARALLAADAEPNATDAEGNTPLHRAARTPYPEVTKALLDGAANPNAKNSAGDTPLHLVVRPNPYHLVAQALLDGGANPNVKNSAGDTPLHWVTGVYGTSDAVKTLLDSGANPNAKKQDGDAPLHYITKLDVANALLAAGAKPNVRDNSRGTPLHRAFRTNPNSDIHRVLLDGGADPSIRDCYGRTACDYARRRFKADPSKVDARICDKRIAAAARPETENKLVVIDDIGRAHVHCSIKPHLTPSQMTQIFGSDYVCFGTCDSPTSGPSLGAIPPVTPTTPPGGGNPIAPWCACPESKMTQIEQRWKNVAPQSWATILRPFGSLLDKPHRLRSPQKPKLPRFPQDDRHAPTPKDFRIPPGLPGGGGPPAFPGP